ncbi:hypothetical protein BJ742DRAFT_895233 [Cladochytrium replicatum]|nr:hypothetical protein BJ742DRAFT_895233 [Cladochytrium replicatum]
MDIVQSGYLIQPAEVPASPAPPCQDPHLSTLIQASEASAETEEHEHVPPSDQADILPDDLCSEEFVTPARLVRPHPQPAPSGGINPSCHSVNLNSYLPCVRAFGSIFPSFQLDCYVIRLNFTPSETGYSPHHPYGPADDISKSLAGYSGLNQISVDTDQSLLLIFSNYDSAKCLWDAWANVPASANFSLQQQPGVPADSTSNPVVSSVAIPLAGTPWIPNGLSQTPPIPQNRHQFSRSDSSVAQNAATATVPPPSSLNPRVTIHVTNVTLDMADLKKYFSSFPGFTKIDFHIGASCYVCFTDFESASVALESIHRAVYLSTTGLPPNSLPQRGSLQGTMRATFDVTYTPFWTRPSSNPPNSVLHVTIYPANAPHPDIAKILQQYEGFERVVFESGSCLSYFRDIDCAKRALEDLNTTTNLVTNYTRKEAPRNQFGGNSASGVMGCAANQLRNMSQDPTDLYSGNRAEEQPKTTIQITNLCMDRADLRSFVMNCAGFRKLAFYRDWCFACFADIESASKSIVTIHQSSTMRATFTKVEYTQKYTPHNIGHPNPTLYVNNLPFNATTAEFTKLFATYDGFRDAYFFRGSCKVYFSDLVSSWRALEDLNRTTNLIATYYHGSSKASGSGIYAAAAPLTPMGLRQQCRTPSEAMFAPSSMVFRNGNVAPAICTTFRAATSIFAPTVDAAEFGGSGMPGYAFWPLHANDTGSETWNYNTSMSLVWSSPFGEPAELAQAHPPSLLPSRTSSLSKTLVDHLKICGSPTHDTYIESKPVPAPDAGPIEVIANDPPDPKLSGGIDGGMEMLQEDLNMSDLRKAGSEAYIGVKIAPAAEKQPALFEGCETDENSPETATLNTESVIESAIENSGVLMQQNESTSHKHSDTSVMVTDEKVENAGEQLVYPSFWMQDHPKPVASPCSPTRAVSVSELLFGAQSPNPIPVPVHRTTSLSSAAREPSSILNTPSHFQKRKPAPIAKPWSSKYTYDSSPSKPTRMLFGRFPLLLARHFRTETSESEVPPLDVWSSILSPVGGSPQHAQTAAAAVAHTPSREEDEDEEGTTVGEDELVRESEVSSLIRRIDNLEEELQSARIECEEWKKKCEELRERQAAILQI